jgi:hypothetical protein
MLNGEISLAVLKQFLNLLDTLERSMSKKDALRDGWYERKADYIFSSFGYLAKGGRGRLDRASTARFRGHKSPQLESLFEPYEKHFTSVGMAPLYFYCARNAFDCWRSYRAMPWNGYDDVGQFLKHYMISFETLARMQDAAPGRVFVLNLDELKASADPIAFYRDKLFGRLGLTMPERVARRIANLAEQKRPSAHDALSEADRRTIAGHRGMRALYREKFAPHITKAHL